MTCEDVAAIKRVHSAAKAYAFRLGAYEIADDIAQEVVTSFIFGHRKQFVIKTAVIDAIRKLLGSERNRKKTAKTLKIHVPIDECAGLEAAPSGDLFWVDNKDRRFFQLKYVEGYSWDELIAAGEFTFHECVAATNRVKSAIKKELIKGDL
jgi:hypothetical protein